MSFRRLPRRLRNAVIEPCEVRRMFVTYQVTGTAGDDSISISINGNSIISAVNGVSDSASDIINNTIEISGLGGNDTISITETGNNDVVVNAGSGDDTINVGNGANNLDVIDGNVTVNGDAGSDQTIFFDTARLGDMTYTSSLGNKLVSGSMPVAIVNTEDVEVKPNNAGDSVLRFVDPPSADWHWNGLGGANEVRVEGAAGESITYRTGGTSGGSGHVDFQSSSLEFFGSPILFVTGMPSVTMKTSFQIDNFSVTANAASTIVSGTSSGTVPAALHMDNVGTCTLDMGTNDGASTDDTLTFSNVSPDATFFRVDLGGGNNTINVNASNELDTRVGFAGGQFNTINIDTATATFHNLQTPKHLNIRDNGTAAFEGSGVLLTTPDLQLPAGKGTINLPSGASGSVASTFAIASGAELIKKGSGAFTSAASVVQTHAVNSALTVENGTLTLLNDAGSTTSRRLNASANAGTLVFGTSQHLKSVYAGTGTVRLSPNGGRVIVTEAIGVNTDTGGDIDLTNNNLMLDYAGASQLGVIKDLLTGGFAGGAWNGIGIDSSTAASVVGTGLGYVESTDLFTTFPATFVGETIDSTAVLVRYTFYGDTNLDRTVNFDDLLRLAQNYGPTIGNKLWRQGNSNYNTADTTVGAVGFDDLLALSQNYNLSMLSSVAGSTWTRRNSFGRSVIA